MTAIYHITHLANLPNILRDGGLWCDRIVSQQNKAHVNIAHRHIKERRAEKRVPCAPGGVLADYVPFYFAPRSPMLYTINRGNVEGYQDGQRPIVHLVSSAEAAQDADLPFVFTDGHADMDISRFFTDLNDLDEIDWDIMAAKYWRETLEDGDRKRRRQAEFLVCQFFPFSLVEMIGVINQSIAEQVSAIFATLSLIPPIQVRSTWYYS
jgi:hypothetical protein